MEINVLKKNLPFKRSILNTLSEGIFIVSSEYKIVDCNKAFCGLIEDNKGNIIGEKCYRIMHGRDRWPHSCLLCQARRQRRKIETEIWEPYLKKDVDIISRYIEDGQSKGYGFHIVKDVTRECQKAKMEIRRDNFLRDITHELKTPLAIAQMAGEMCQRGIEGDDMERVKKSHQIAFGNIQRMRRTIENVLEVFSQEGVRLLKQKGWCSLEGVINRIVGDMRHVIDAKGLKLNVKLSPETDKIFANKNDLRTLLYNIIDNAIKFTDKGYISISSKLKGNNVNIRVKDTGFGILAPTLGLGLSICKEIVNKYKGKIKIFSKGRNQGTIVIVSLPQK
jgi:signal transduction histidine kinase